MVKLSYRKYFIWEGFFNNPTGSLIGVLFERRICKPYPPNPQILDNTEHALPCPPQNAPIQSALRQVKKQSRVWVCLQLNMTYG
jgi:hypothetical protein